MPSILTDSHLHDLESLARLTRIRDGVASGQLNQTEALDELRALNLPGVQVAGLEATRNEAALEAIGGGPKSA